METMNTQNSNRQSKVNIYKLGETIKHSNRIVLHWKLMKKKTFLFNSQNKIKEYTGSAISMIRNTKLPVLNMVLGWLFDYLLQTNQTSINYSEVLWAIGYLFITFFDEKTLIHSLFPREDGFLLNTGS